MEIAGTAIFLIGASVLTGTGVLQLVLRTPVPAGPVARLAGVAGGVGAAAAVLSMGAADFRWALLAVGAGAALLARPNPGVGWAGAAGAGAAALVVHAASGHARDLPYPVVGVAVDAVHMVAAAAWVGGIPAILMRLRSGGDSGERARIVAAFSTLAAWALATVVLSGLILSFGQLGSLANLALSPWGRALSVKLLLVAFLVAAGAFNRFVLLPALESGSPVARERLMRTLVFEGVLASAILTAAAVLSSLPTPGLG